MNPNESTGEDDALRMLFQNAYPPLADDGFTRRVMARLGPQPTLTPTGYWWAAIGGFAGTAIAGAAIGFGPLSESNLASTGQNVAEVFRVLLRPELGIVTVAVALGLGFTWRAVHASSGQRPLV